MNGRVPFFRFFVTAFVTVWFLGCAAGGGDSLTSETDGDLDTTPSPQPDGDTTPEDGDTDLDNDAEMTGNTVSLVIGPNGGTLDHPQGCSLFLPSGALSEDTEITIRTVNATLPGTFWPMSPVCEFGPVGLELNDKARFTLSYRGFTLPEGYEPYHVAMMQQNPDDTQSWRSLTVRLNEATRNVEADSNVLAVLSLAVELNINPTDGDEDVEEMEIICEAQAVECRNNESGTGQLYRCQNGTRWQFLDNCVQRDPCDFSRTIFVPCLDATNCPNEFAMADGDIACETDEEIIEEEEEEAEPCMDDVYDQNGQNNDSRPNATPVEPDGRMEGLILCPGTRDTYSVTVGAGSQLVATILFSHAEGDLDLRLYRANGTLLSTAQTQTDNETVQYIVTTAGLYYLEVRGKHDDDGALYDLIVTIDGGGACTDDAYDILGNDDVYAAQLLGVENQTFSNLSVCDGDPDWYKFTLLGNRLFVADISLTAQASVDLTVRLTDQWGTNLVYEETVNTSDGRTIEVPIAVTAVYAMLVDLPLGQSMTYSLHLNQEEIPVEDGDIEEIAQARAPLAGEVIFTEILRNPLGPEDALREWFELENVGTQEIDLYGCRFADTTQAWNIIPDSLPLAPGERAVFARSAENPNVTPDVVWSRFALQNDGAETLTLQCGETVIDTVTFGGTNWLNPVGASLQLSSNRKNATDNDNYQSWCEALLPFGDSADLGTPGGQNLLCDTVEPYIPPAVAQPLVGEVMVNELMVHPTGITDENGQWIEVKNIADHAVNLQGCRYGNGGTLAWQDIMTRMVLEPEETALFAANDNPMQNGGLDPEHRFITSRLLLNRVTDTVRLSCSGEIIDRVDYDINAWGIPVGRSVQVDVNINDALANDEAQSWCPAETAYSGGNYGTPGAPNDSCIPEMDGDVDLDEDIEEEAELAESGQPWPGAGDLVITEIMVLPTAAGMSTGQWFELTNRSDHTVDLLGCEVADGVNTRWQRIDHYLFVAQDQAVVFGRSASVAENGGLTPVHSTFSFELGSYGDKVRLRCGATLIDEVEYEAAWGVTSGYSLSLDFFQTNADANNLHENWCLGRATYNGLDYGSPASLNPSCD